ncbi:MAG TPA: hypothetical protein VEL76_01205 [Gemmataceae bacterium]|nr:hypothetical protein [Gemmataceae bacterium]
MLGADTLRNRQQPRVGVEVVDAAERGEGGTQLKGEEARAIAPESAIGVEKTFSLQRCQAVGLEDDRGTAVFLNGVDGPAVIVEAQRLARLVADERARDEGAATEDRAGRGQDCPARGVIEEVDVAGIHVDGRCQAGGSGAGDVSLEAVPIHVAVVAKRQQDRGHTNDFALRPEPGRRVQTALGHRQLPSKSSGQRVVRARKKARTPLRCGPGKITDGSDPELA